MKDLLHEHARGILQHCGQQHAPQKEEKGACGQLRQKDAEKRGAEAVNGAEGAVHEAPVHELPAADGGMADLDAPACKGIEKEQPCDIG